MNKHPAPPSEKPKLELELLIKRITELAQKRPEKAAFIVAAWLQEAERHFKKAG
jgi:flagellar biosynthesis/type III secretory pathway M-ring protein FliF/YscJ